MRKPVFGVSDKTGFKPVSSATENWNFTCSKFTYETFQKVNNKGADQTSRMRRLVCDCVVKNPRRQVFSQRGPNIYIDQNPLLHCSVQDQTARMRRLVCACVVKKTNRRQVSSWRGPYISIVPLFGSRNHLRKSYFGQIWHCKVLVWPWK